MWVAKEVTESRARANQGALFSLGLLLHIPHHNTTMWAAPPWSITKALPLQCNRPTETKKYDPNERTVQKSRKKLSDEKISNLSDAQFKYW